MELKTHLKVLGITTKALAEGLGFVQEMNNSRKEWKGKISLQAMHGNAMTAEVTILEIGANFMKPGYILILHKIE